MGILLKQYKGEQSNFECIKNELENVIEELDNVNRLRVTNEVAESVLEHIKQMRLEIICNY